MTRSQYRAIDNKVRWITTAWTVAFIALVLGFFRLAGKWLRQYGDALRARFGSAGAAWVAAALLGLLVLAIYAVVVIVLDRRHGVRCPHCHRSITLRCQAERVLESGECTLCHAKIFDDRDDG